MITVDHIDAPQSWACYLIYGDPSGMSPADVAAADRFTAYIAPAYIVSVYDDSFFKWDAHLTNVDRYSGTLCRYVTHQHIARRVAA